MINSPQPPATGGQPVQAGWIQGRSGKQQDGEYSAVVGRRMAYQDPSA